MRQSADAIGETIQSRGGELLNGCCPLRWADQRACCCRDRARGRVLSAARLGQHGRAHRRPAAARPRATIRDLARDIDRTLAASFAAKGTVCLILGTYYAVALMLAG